MKTLLAFQKLDGLVEGAYPDGNWLRTVLVYALWKTQGTSVHPWRQASASVRIVTAMRCWCRSTPTRSGRGVSISIARATAV